MASIARSVSADETIALGTASEDGVGTIAISITNSAGAGSVSIIPKGRIIGSGVASGEYQNLAYRPANSGTTTNPGTTAITGEGIYHIPADGCEVFLAVDVTGVFSFDLHAIPLRG